MRLAGRDLHRRPGDDRAARAAEAEDRDAGAAADGAGVTAERRPGRAGAHLERAGREAHDRAGAGTRDAHGDGGRRGRARAVADGDAERVEALEAGLRPVGHRRALDRSQAAVRGLRGDRIGERVAVRVGAGHEDLRRDVDARAQLARQAGRRRLPRERDQAAGGSGVERVAGRGDREGRRRAELGERLAAGCAGRGDAAGGRSVRSERAGGDVTVEREDRAVAGGRDGEARAVGADRECDRRRQQRGRGAISDALADAAGHAGGLQERAAGGIPLQDRDGVARGRGDVDVAPARGDRECRGLCQRAARRAAEAAGHPDAAGRAGLLRQRAGRRVALQDGDGVRVLGGRIQRRAVGRDRERVDTGQRTPGGAFAGVAAADAGLARRRAAAARHRSDRSRTPQRRRRRGRPRRGCGRPARSPARSLRADRRPRRSRRAHRGERSRQRP